MLVRLLLAVAALVTLVAPPARACDVCAIYTATELRERRVGPWLGVAEQFSRFGTLRRDGAEVDNPGERVHSSITQVLFGWDFLPELGVQLAVPIITRDFRRLEDGVLRDGDETGLGDLSLLAVVRPYSWVGEETVLRFSLFGGLKLPSGDTDRLREETEEGHHGEDDEPADGDHHARAERHEGEDHGDEGGEEVSGVHGHDLTLGSGSVDGIVGGSVFASYRRVFLTAGLQYAIRTTGAVDYRYANDLIWSGGPGVFALLAPEYTLALQALVTGEYKAKDSLDGVDVGDTAITAVYLGPGLTLTWKSVLAADVAADLPVSQDNSGLQIVPDWRIRGGITWHF